MAPSGSLDVDGSLDVVVEAVFLASRELVAVAARSIAAIADDVTLSQFRALVVLAAGEIRNVGALADALGVHPSSATRMCDRLVKRALVRRSVPDDNRREVVLELSPTGRRLVDDVVKRRRKEIGKIVARLSPADRVQVLRGLAVFGTAAAEVPRRAQPDWLLP
jgi:DNA-binding MarR family transcriptional regulator